MGQTERLNELRSSFSLYNTYIVNSFLQDANGVYLFNKNYQNFSVTSSFIGIYISWEYFLEQTFIGYMVGDVTISGNIIGKHVTPQNNDHANRILIGTQKYVDWSNPDILLKLSNLYFNNGEPFHTVINSIKAILFDLKTIRNACAHLSSTTYKSLDSLASRLLNTTVTNIIVPDLILKTDPNGNGTDTILDMYLQYLDAAAQNLSQ